MYRKGIRLTVIVVLVTISLHVIAMVAVLY